MDTYEDRVRFADHERQVICRRWRLFAPLMIVLIGLTEVAPLFSTQFPSSPGLSLSAMGVLTVMYVLARREPSRRVMGWASAVTSILIAAYSATAAVETGRFQSLHVLAMVVLMGVLPGIFALSLAEAAVGLGGGCVAWVTVCLLWGTDGPVDLSGLEVSSVYLVFLGVVTLVANQTNQRLRLREFVAQSELERMHRFAVEEVLCRHLPPRYVERVLSGEHPLDGPPERRLVTVVFADIVSFTPLSDALAPEALAEVMARFYDVTAAVAFAHGATLDKFIGDAVMALLGAPDALPPEEQARRAVAMAHDWHRMVGELSWPGAEGRRLELRVGLHQDVVVVGAFGGRLRSDYTVLGRGVTLAARLEQRCAPGATLVSETVFRLLSPRPQGAEDLGALSLKGMPVPVRCFSLRGPGGGPGPGGPGPSSA